MLFHEYDAPGGAFRGGVAVVRRKRDAEENEVDDRKISLIYHLTTSLYMSFLAFYQKTYALAVVSLGGKIQLLSLMIFMLLILALYTANLAALLATETKKPDISNINEAVGAGYNFCSERKNAAIVMDLNGVSPNLIVPDPVEVGGDGKPGFNCPKCAARTRVFEYMRPVHDDNSLFCNAAFASAEDLEVLHKLGDHCDKVIVGEILAHTNVGVPLYEGVSDELLSLFHKKKNDGVLQRELQNAKPNSLCIRADIEGTSLTVEQFTGIWMITFTLAVGGLLAKAIQWCYGKLRNASQGVNEMRLQQFDQWRNPVDTVVVFNGMLYINGSHEGSSPNADDAESFHSCDVKPRGAVKSIIIGEWDDVGIKD